MATPKNRTQLQNLFKSGAKPSEADFKDLIDGVLNISDDGIQKQAGSDNPLKILTHGDQENVLDIYAGDTPTWRLNQKPTADTQGFNLETGGSSKLFVESGTGNVGIGETKPIAKLHIQQSGSQDALRINDEANDATPLIVDAEGKVGIGTDKPSVSLDVKGDTAIAGTLSVTNNLNISANKTVLFADNGQIGSFDNKHEILFRRSENILEIREFGNIIFSSGATEGKETQKMILNAAGDLTIKGTATSSLAGSLSISKTLSVSQTSVFTGNVSLGENLSVTGTSFLKGVMTGAANDYEKAQFTLSGGGTVSWGGPGQKLKWTVRFIAIAMGKNSSFSNGHINITQPIINIPAGNVHDGIARSANADGVTLNAWEALYAVHTVGGDSNAVSFQIVVYDKNFTVPSNWILVGVVNHDDSTIKLGTGLTLSKNSSSTKGSPIPTGIIMIWSGAENTVPDGWALCNGTNGTPDLRGRFVLSSGNVKGLTNRIIGQTGGVESHVLTTKEMPSHSHSINDPSHYHNWTASRQLQGTDDKNYTSEVSKGDASSADTMSKNTDSKTTGITINDSGANQAHENMPPFFVLAYIMKL